MDESRYPKEVVERVYRRRGRLHAFTELEPARTALLVVDLQVTFMKPGSPFELPSARDVVPAVNRLAAAIRDTGGVVVWVVSTYGPAKEDRWPVHFDYVLSPEMGMLFRDGLSTGAEGHRIWTDLDYRPGEPVIDKNRFGGFIGSNGKLEAELRGRGIDTVLVVGTVTNVCCETTAREAAMLDFKTIMISDGNAGRSAAADLQTYSVFLATMGDVMTADEAIALLEAGQAPAGRATSDAQDQGRPLGQPETTLKSDG